MHGQRNLTAANGFNNQGDILIATDGMPGSLEENDGVFGVPTEGPNRGHLRRICSTPVGAECASLEFSSDYETLFISVQHPGEGEESNVENPASMWPNNESPPRPSIVAITKTGGGMIGA